MEPIQRKQKIAVFHFLSLNHDWFLCQDGANSTTTKSALFDTYFYSMPGFLCQALLQYVWLIFILI